MTHREDELHIKLIEMTERAIKAEALCDKYFVALKYYAETPANPNDGPWGLRSDDFGRCARKALEGE